MQHWSNDRAVNSQKGELHNYSEVFLPDISPMRKGYPYLSPVGINSNVKVYDEKTGKLLRLETPYGEIIETY